MKFIKIFAIFMLIFVIFSVIYLKIILKPNIKIENITTNSDINKNWIDDISDILIWARKEVENKTNYKSAYYSWWYPPSDEWVCTDVVWRALIEAGINIKDLIDKDIKNNISSYPRVWWRPDSNIDFRRVPNLDTYLKRNTLNLTTEVIPLNKENLSQWQPWDIVTFWKPHEHTWIISSKRNKDWVPYLIHNAAPVPKEQDILIYWDKNLSPIIGHYRFRY